MSHLSILPKDISTKDLYQLIIGTVNPRPIALVSTMNSEGQNNLAPYSFFNALSSNPPLLAFSCNLLSEGKEKDTLKNLKATQSCVVNIVNFKMSRQMSLTSIMYDHGVSEFKKSGLTPLDSLIVKAKRVKESPVQIECTVVDIIALGSQQGASNLVICKIETMHVLRNIMYENKLRIDPQKLDVMGRLGRSNYVRVKGDNIIEMYQSTVNDCLGYDNLPASITHSKYLSGNEIAELAAEKKLPDYSEIQNFVSENNIVDTDLATCHKKSSTLINNKKSKEALIYAMIPELKK